MRQAHFRRGQELLRSNRPGIDSRPASKARTNAKKPSGKEPPPRQRRCQIDIFFTTFLMRGGGPVLEFQSDETSFYSIYCNFHGRAIGRYYRFWTGFPGAGDSQTLRATYSIRRDRFR